MTSKLHFQPSNFKMNGLNSKTEFQVNKYFIGFQLQYSVSNN